MFELQDCPVCGCQDILLKRQYRRVYYECAKCHCVGYSARSRLGAKANWNNEEYRERARYNKKKPH